MSDRSSALFTLQSLSPSPLALSDPLGVNYCCSAIIYINTSSKRIFTYIFYNIGTSSSPFKSVPPTPPPSPLQTASSSPLCHRSLQHTINPSAPRFLLSAAERGAGGASPDTGGLSRPSLPSLPLTPWFGLLFPFPPQKRRRPTTGCQLDDKRREMLKRHPLSLCLDLKCKGAGPHPDPARRLA